MPLLEDGHEVAKDPWQFLQEDEPLPSSGDVVVSLERLQKEKELLRRHQGRCAVLLASGQSPHLLKDDLSLCAMIVLDISNFKDGRAFSSARVLRERYGYRGIIRVRGAILQDQLLFYHRCGVDAIQSDARITAQAWDDALAELSYAYQPASDKSRSIMSLRARRKNKR